MSSGNIRNQHELHFFGLQRTGNHAIISWVLDHLEGVSIHLNDIKPFDSDPYNSFAQVRTKNISFWKLKPSPFSFVRHALASRTDTYKFVRSDSKLALQYLKERPKDNLLLSYENYHLDAPQILELNAHHDEFVGPSKVVRRIVLLRDPFNLFASLMKAKMIEPDDAEHFRSVYKQYSNTFIDHQQATRNDFVCINYNEWFCDADYRKSVASAIGFETDGRPNQRVREEGAGSSFDGLSLDGDATRLKVLERWKHFEEDPIYLRFLNDSELISLASQIFDFESLGVSSLIDRLSRL